MSTYESHTTVGFAIGSSATLNKPTGLAVGDFMYAFLACQTSSTQYSYSTPSGWTSHINTNPGSNSWRMQTFYKVADSADVAASNFVFSLSGSTLYAGSLFRISSFGNINQTSSTYANNTTTSPFTLTGFTPDRENCLFFLALVGGQSGSTTPSFSDYTIATDDPSWTERFELTDASNDAAFAVATATRSQKTATGTASITITTPPTNGDYSGAMVAMAPTVSATSTPDAIAITTRVDVLLSPTSSSLTVNSVTSTSVTQTDWTNETKPTAPTWTNQDK